MYFWNINALKNDLSQGGISETESFKYLLANILINCIPSASSNTPDDLAHTIYPWVRIVIILLGTLYAFHKNGGQKGHDFILRYMSTLWVTGIRWAICISIPFMIVVGILSIPLDSPKYLPGWLVVVTAFYWRVSAHVQDVAAKTENV